MPNGCLGTVVVPLYQDGEVIGRCLDSLLAQTIASSLEIVVVDDGSRDGGDVIVGRYPVRLVRQRNAGPAAARNRGAGMAAGPVLVFLDSDCTVEPKWAERVLAYFEDSTVTSVLCPLASANDGIVPTLVQSEIEERYRRLREGGRPVDFLAGAACAVRTEAFKRLGGFNENFRYNEDVELAFRLTDAGGRIIFADVPLVRHQHQATWRDLLLTKFWRGVWRIRLYRLFPHKRLADAWTPWSLKFQVLAILLLPPIAVLGLVEPASYALAALLAAAVPISGAKLLADTSAALEKPAGRMAPILATAWIFARAGTLALAVVFARLVPWQATPMAEMLSDQTD